MKKTIPGFLLAVSLVCGILSACGEAPTSETTQTGQAELAGTEENDAKDTNESKSIVFGMNGTWNSLMPFDAATTNSWIVQDLLYEPLGKYGDGKVVWRAANSIDVSEDGKTWTVHLNDQVKWQDGEPSTAEDWVWTMETVCDPDFGIYKGMASRLSGSLFQGKGRSTFRGYGYSVALETKLRKEDYYL